MTFGITSDENDELLRVSIPVVDGKGSQEGLRVRTGGTGTCSVSS